MSTQAPARTGAQTALLVLGTLLIVGGLVCVGVGFVGFDSAPDVNDTGVDKGMALLAGGGLAAVVGLGIIGFTRARMLTGNGGYARVTYEQGIAPAGGRYCSGCGRPTSPSARFCDSCGATLA